MDEELRRLREGVSAKPRGKAKGARRPNEPEMMGAKEIAEELGTRQSNIRTIVGLPEPYASVAATTLWRADEVREFAAERRERRGEP